MKTKEFNRLNDYYFKNLLGDEKRKNLTLDFLNSVFSSDGEVLFTNLRFMDREFEPISPDSKLSRLDILAELNNGDIVDIEVQVCRQNYMTERSMYYMTRIFSENLKSGEKYTKLSKVIAINILDFNLLENISTWHNIAHFALDNYHTIITDCMEMHFLEIPKLKFSDIKKLKRLDTWGAYFSNKCTDKELEELIMINPSLKEVVSYEKYFNSNDELRMQYQKREDAILDEKFRAYAAMQNGIKKGKQDEKIQNAINFLKLGAEPDFVARGTRLDLNTVLELQKQLNK